MQDSYAMLKEMGLTDDQIQGMLDEGIDLDQAVQLYQSMMSEQMGSMLESEYEHQAELAGQQGPEGRYTGRAYVAADPLEHLAHGVKTTMAGIERNKIAEERRQLAEQRRKAAAVAGAMAGHSTKGRPTAQPQPAPGMAMNQAQANQQQAAKLFPFSPKWMKA